VKYIGVKLMNSRSYLILAGLISLLIHFLTGFGLEKVSSHSTRERRSDSFIEVEISDAREPQKKIRVLDEDVPEEELIDSSRETPLIGKSHKRVRDQKIAEATGITVNRINSPSRRPVAPKSRATPSANKKKSLQVDSHSQGSKEKFPLLTSDLGNFSAQSGEAKKKAKNEVSTGLENPQLNLLPRIDGGISTFNGIAVEKIKFGDFTSLDTDADYFYSFFSRNAPGIRFRWENHLTRAIEDLYFRQPLIERRSVWITDIEIVITKEGRYLESKILVPSGLPTFDQAARRALQDATPFNNPPQGMVGDDGLIHLKYRFKVNWDSRYIAKPRGP